jgi:hypothetical protein
MEAMGGDADAFNLESEADTELARVLEMSKDMK